MRLYQDLQEYLKSCGPGRTMYKLCLIALLVAPAPLLSQTVEGASSSLVASTDSSSSSSSSNTDIMTASAPVAGAQQNSSEHSSDQGFFGRGLFAKPRKDTPVATFTASYVYRYAPDLFGANRSQMGWSAVPHVNFTKYVGLQADFTSLYTRSIYPGTSQLMIAAGPRFTFAPRSRFTPFVFMEGGEIRTTRQLSHASDWNPVAAGGLGLDFKAGKGKGLAFQLVPGEYVGQYLDDGSWNHSFMAKAGITFNLFK
jgi:hypothetical protein